LILTKSGNLPKAAQVFTDEFRHRTFVVTDLHTSIEALPPQQVIRLSTLSPFPFEELYQRLSVLNIHSLWLEGGSLLHSLFLNHRQVQRMVLYLAPKIMGEGKTLFHHQSSSLTELPLLDKMEVHIIGADIKISSRII
jgi:diaminohydroxyphosphoribosylaminopyrimidine deaminase/5-amino-6-(5-phosphoribosylamino)uracil reductase